MAARAQSAIPIGMPTLTDLDETRDCPIPRLAAAVVIGQADPGSRLRHSGSVADPQASTVEKTVLDRLIALAKIVSFSVIQRSDLTSIALDDPGC